MALRTEIKTYPVEALTDSIHNEINILMLDCIKNGRVPYVQDKPLPQDVNIVNGRHMGDINKVYLELKASSMGAESLKWIYGADAALIGLEKKEGTEPIMITGNVRGNLDSQSVYLIDQFTEESLNKALAFSRSDEDKKKKTIAQNMIKNISEYDAGNVEASLREQKRKNISNNFKNPGVLNDVKAGFENATSNYDNYQKTIFSALNNYYIKQETGLELKKPLTEEEKKEVIQALEKTANTPSPRLALTLSDSFLYSERMTHFDFEQNRIFTQEDLEKRLAVTSPKASEFEPKRSPELEQDKKIEKLREREVEIKPRHITHQRGF